MKEAECGAGRDPVSRRSPRDPQRVGLADGAYGGSGRAWSRPRPSFSGFGWRRVRISWCLGRRFLEHGRVTGGTGLSGWHYPSPWCSCSTCGSRLLPPVCQSPRAERLCWEGIVAPVLVYTVTSRGSYEWPVGSSFGSPGLVPCVWMGMGTRTGCWSDARWCLRPALLRSPGSSSLCAGFSRVPRLRLISQAPCARAYVCVCFCGDDRRDSIGRMTSAAGHARQFSWGGGPVFIGAFGSGLVGLDDITGMSRVGVHGISGHAGCWFPAFLG